MLFLDRLRHGTDGDRIRRNADFRAWKQLKVFQPVIQRREPVCRDFMVRSFQHVGHLHLVTDVFEALNDPIMAGPFRDQTDQGNAIFISKNLKQKPGWFQIAGRDDENGILDTVCVNDTGRDVNGTKACDLGRSDADDFRLQGHSDGHGPSHVRRRSMRV